MEPSIGVLQAPGLADAAIVELEPGGIITAG
jgi:hypothetical protein